LAPVLRIDRETILVLESADNRVLWPYVTRNPFVRWLYWSRLAKIVRYFPKKVGRLLDIGFGGGLFLPTYSHLCDEVVALDITLVPMASKILKSASCSNVCLIQSDAQSLCFKDHSFDLVTATSSLEHIPDLACALDEICRVLKPSGTLISITPFENSVRHAARMLLRLSRPDHHHDARGVLAGLRNRFENVNVLNIPRAPTGSLSLFQLAVGARPLRTGRGSGKLSSSQMLQSETKNSVSNQASN